MTSENFSSALRSFYRRRPPRSFVVELNTGEQLVIRHPEAIAMRGDMIVFVTPRSRYQLFDSGSVNQLLDLPDEKSS
jgi:hypothetical protein